MTDIATLMASDFANCEGKPILLYAQGAQHALQLESVTPLASPSPRQGGPFSAVLRGPRDPLWPQAIYALEHPVLGPLELFIVPIGRDASAARYEAIFN